MTRSTIKNSNVFTLQDSDEEKNPVVPSAGRKDHGINKVLLNFKSESISYY